ncbi:hypothetical protein O9G_002777, partial [Rozella allomycis CSF55]
DQFSEKNTVIIDDSTDKVCQNGINAHVIPEYDLSNASYNAQKDTVLLQLKSHLEKWILSDYCDNFDYVVPIENAEGCLVSALETMVLTDLEPSVDPTVNLVIPSVYPTTILNESESHSENESLNAVNTEDTDRELLSKEQNLDININSNAPGAMPMSLKKSHVQSEKILGLNEHPEIDSIFNESDKHKNDPEELGKRNNENIVSKESCVPELKLDDPELELKITSTQ